MKGNFGLDIGSSSIKAVWMKKGNVGTAVYDIPFGLSERERYKSITRGIEKIVRENKPGSKRAVCVISGDFVFVHHFKLPITKEDKLKSAVVLEAKKYLPSSIKDIVLDFVVLKEDVILAAAEEGKFRSYLSCIRKAGVKPVRVNVSAFALLGEELTAFIDIGAGKTNVSIVKGRSLLFNRQVSIAGNSITAVLSEDMGISMKEAEELKRNKRDLLSSNGREFAIVRPVLERISLEIGRSFDYFSMGDGGKVRNVLISGGGAKLEGFDRFLSEKLSADVKVYAPLVNGREIDTQFAAAAGALLGEYEGPDLLSAKVRGKRGLYSYGVVRYAAVAAIVVFLAGYTALIHVKKNYKQKLALLADVAKEIDILKNLDRERREWNFVLDEISRVIPNGVWMTALTANKKGEICITGRAISNQLVDGFLTNLSNSSLFKNVALVSKNSDFSITMDISKEGILSGRDEQGVNEGLDSLRSRFSKTGQTGLVMQHLAKAANETGINLVSIDSLPIIKQDKYSELPISIRLNGGYYGIAGYLKKLHDFAKVIDVREVKVKNDETAPRRLNVDLLAVVYMLK